MQEYSQPDDIRFAHMKKAAADYLGKILVRGSKLGEVRTSPVQIAEKLRNYFGLSRDERDARMEEVISNMLGNKPGDALVPAFLSSKEYNPEEERRLGEELDQREKLESLRQPVAKILAVLEHLADPSMRVTPEAGNTLQNILKEAASFLTAEVVPFVSEKEVFSAAQTAPDKIWNMVNRLDENHPERRFLTPKQKKSHYKGISEATGFVHEEAVSVSSAVAGLNSLVHELIRISEGKGRSGGKVVD